MIKALEKLKELIEDNVKGEYKDIFIGDPIIIPISSLPALVIHPVSTEFEDADNKRDFVKYQIDVSILLNLATYLGNGSNISAGYIEMTDFFESQDSNGNYNDDALMKVLRNNMNLDTNIRIENISDIEYFLRKRDEESLLLEGVLHMEIITVQTYA